MNFKVKKQKKAYTYSVSVIPTPDENGAVNVRDALVIAAHELVNKLPYRSLVSLFKCDVSGDKFKV